MFNKKNIGDKGMIKLSKVVLSYKDYKVKKSLSGDFEIWDHTFKTPTTWLCWIFSKFEYTKEKAIAKIEECIINNRIAREESK